MQLEDRTLALAQVVRARRQLQGLSLDELATRSGVSKGAIVALEHGDANPTFGTLVRLADALQIPMSELFDLPATAPVRLVPAAEQPVLWRGPHGGEARLTLTVAGAAPVEYWEWTLHAGEQYESHPHPAGVQEVVTVHEGALTLTVGGESWRVVAGTTALFSADQAHAYAAEGEGCRFSMQVHLPTSHGGGTSGARLR
ncbi:MAG: helix-turn-helix domain-containing protein [Thermomicrobiales bacterium]